MVSFRKLLNLRITINPISLFALLLFVMMFHGIFVGVLNHNAPFVILNDTIPILMIALNILRMQSVTEMSKPIDFRFLYIFAIICVSLICVFGYLTGRVFVGNPSLFYPLLGAAIVIIRPFPLWTLPFAIGIIIFTADDINRTSMMFFVIILVGSMGVNAVRQPTKSVILAMGAAVVLLAAWSLITEGSQTYNRIIGLANIDLSKRTGSIGERQAERDAINLKLEKAGPTTQWTGGGFGALYNVQFTHKYVKDYGHAHYAWAWFNLRFGKMGYFYMTLFIFTIIYSGIHNFRQQNEVGFFITCLCISAFLYVFTHVNSIWLLSGLHFLYQTPKINNTSRINNSLKTT